MNPADRPAPPFTFYTGTHRSSWLMHMDVPLFISASTVHRFVRERRPAWTSGCGIWAFDSGAYGANTTGNPAHPWHLDPDDYGGMVTRVMEQVGVPPQFAAPQDWPCEPEAAPAWTTAERQVFTLDSFTYLAEQFDHVPWAPVIQGWKTADYIRHLRMHEDRGVDLTAYDTVGLGSVCRRGSVRAVVEIVEAVQDYARRRYGRPLPLHGFGLNIRALRRCSYLLASSDSLSWSDTARWDHIRLPSCTHRARYCVSCPDWALTSRARVLEAVAAPVQLTLDGVGIAA